jgi:hypothetical protein
MSAPLANRITSRHALDSGASPGADLHFAVAPADTLGSFGGERATK